MIISMSRIPIFTAALVCVLIASPRLHAEALRAPHLTAAKELLDQGKVDTIAVFLHGSDWHTVGEIVKAKAWDPAALAAALPDNVVLTSIDQLDGRPAILIRQLEDLHATPIPATCSIPTAKNGSLYSLTKEGAWLVNKDGPNPATEIITLRYRPSKATSLLRFSLMTDPSLPKTGPGRAGNGNLYITEIEIHSGNTPDTKIPLRSSASLSSPNRSGYSLTDGNFDKKNGWSAGSKHQTHHLYLVPDKPIPANQEVTITIHFTSQHKNHTPGHFRMDGFDQKDSTAKALELADIQRAAVHNSPYKISTGNYPSLICIEKNGKIFGAQHGLPRDTTAQQMAKKITDLIAARDLRNEYLAVAEKATGEEQIKAYVQAYLIIKEAGVKNHYKEILKRITDLDPERKSGWTWKVALDTGKISKERKLIQEKSGEQAALDYLDTIINDPRTKNLSLDQQQDLLLRKFHIYRGWKDHQDGRFAVLRKIASINPSSHLGIGAQGYIDYHSNGDDSRPSVGFGWKPIHLTKIVDGQLDISVGVPLAFFKPAHYRITLKTHSNKQPLTIESLALLSNGKQIAIDTHTATLAKGADKDNHYDITLPENIEPSTLSLRIRFAPLPEGHEHKLKAITITPYLPADGKFGWE